MKLVIATAIGWLVTGLLYRTIPCRHGVALLSPGCLPDSLEVLVVLGLSAFAPWLTLHAAGRLFVRVRTGELTPWKALGRYSLAALAASAAVSVVGTLAALGSQALGGRLFSGEAGMKVAILGALSIAWGLLSLPVVALVLSKAKEQ